MNDPAPRRRRWMIFAPFVVLMLLAAAWSGFWFYAAGRAQDTLAAWRDREARAGRVYSCVQETVGGFPFRLEVRCATPAAELRNPGGTIVLGMTDMVVAGQVYDPTLLIAEMSGPLTIAEPNRQPTMIASWRLAQSSVRGVPSAPERVSIAVDDARFDQVVGAMQETIIAANRMELHGRLASGSVQDNPIIDVALKLVSALAPTWHPMLAQPVNADLTVTLRGLRNFQPKPWPDRFRELQAQDGRLDITAARIQQGDVIAIGTGALALTPRGGLQGQMQLTIAGIDKVVSRLQPEQIVPPGNAGQLNQTLNRLDRVVPGLGQFARQQAGPALAAGLTVLGQPTRLEGRNAVVVPLRFNDGAVSLGPLPLGKVPPLF